MCVYATLDTEGVIKAKNTGYNRHKLQTLCSLQCSKEHASEVPPASNIWCMSVQAAVVTCRQTDVDRSSHSVNRVVILVVFQPAVCVEGP